MAERKSSKPKKPAPTNAPTRGRAPAAKSAALKTKPTAQPASTPAALQALVERLETKASVLKRERDGLAAELATARAEIATLEKARRDAINRIDWVIDSLQTLLQDKS
jgi:predicted RNase H-like nuclease (RuvC/YqgF family)